MREILTQEEVDALLEAFDNGEIETHSQSKTEFYTPFDFHSCKPIADAQQIIIETIQDAIAKGVGIHLTGALHHEVKVTPSSSYTESTAGFLSHFKGTSCVAVILAENTPGNVFLAITPFLAYSIIDLMLGGEGKIEELEEKEFSPLEVRLVRRILEGIAEVVGKAWGRFAPLRLTFVKVETNPKMLPSREAQDPLYIMSYRMETDGGLSRDFSIALPFSLLEPLKTAPVPVEQDTKSAQLAARIREALTGIPMEITGILGETHLPVRRILSLKPGDVVETTREINMPVLLLVDGKPKFSGRPGVSNGKRAVKILTR
jgi:flagellar motor switch protein FliM